MECKYSAHKLDFLALKWVIIEQFPKNLYGKTFIEYTDKNPHTYILPSAKLDETGHCWVAGLANYNLHLAINQGRQMWMQKPYPAF